MESKAPGWIRQVPNALSGLRLVLAIAFPFLSPGGRLPAVLASGATDWLDGLLARRYGVESTFGGLLDAVADKAFVVAVLLTLASAGVLGWWQVPMVLARDVAVLFTVIFFALRRDWAAFGGMPARWWGKITTTVTFAFFVAVLVPALADLRLPLFLAAASASLIAGVDYLMRFVCTLRTRME